MESGRPYRIDGISFNQGELVNHCRQLSEDPGIAEWNRKVFAFINQFLVTNAGPIFQLTSGTTGKPKKIELEREAMVASARKTISFFDLQPDDRVLLCLPVDYVAGKMMVVRALVGGLDLVLTKPSGRPMEGITGEFSFTAMVPMQVHGSLKAGDDLSVIRKLLLGGGELHPSVRSELNLPGFPAAYESFAMTETYTHFALRRINGPDPDPQFRLLEGVGIRTDERGCLVVNVTGITHAEVVTNDMVEVARDGRSFRWLGRIDNVINSGGIKLIPELMEQRINGILGLECLILPQPDEKLGQKMVLLVEFPDPDPSVQRWFDKLRKHLASHEVPGRIIPVAKLPRNASFKPDRKAALNLFKLFY